MQVQIILKSDIRCSNKIIFFRQHTHRAIASRQSHRQYHLLDLLLEKQFFLIMLLFLVVNS